MNTFNVQHIAIIGGGFSGTMAAVNLARLSDEPLRVTIINHGYPPGRGVAYSTRRPEHLLNVAARNMSALPEHPNHFLEWLRTRTEFVDTPDTELRETFIPRRIYGDYVRSLTLHYTRPVDGRARVETTFVDDEAIDILPSEHGAHVLLASGRVIPADKILLATGNEMPGELPGAEALLDHPAYASNPWLNWEAKLPPPTENIILLGTGLTAVDAIVTILALGWSGTIHAVSRNGLLPQSHFKGVEHQEFPPSEIDLAQLGLAGLVALVKDHCQRLRAAGENPAIVVDKLRPHTQRVWQAFSLSERREFIARYATRWNVMRHRIAQPIHRQVATAIEQGRLKIVSGAVSRLEPRGARIRVHVGRTAEGAANGEVAGDTIDGALVINCTGPQTRFSATRSRLLRNLLASGVVQPDAMDMGVAIGPDFTAVERSGERSPFLHVIGPLLRGTLWETIAVPELRGQALRVAQILLGASRAAPVATKDLEPAVMEYWI
jgi:uncharacterized NAD(P)/FAD-binding protein YdhS